MVVFSLKIIRSFHRFFTIYNTAIFCSRDFHSMVLPCIMFSSIIHCSTYRAYITLHPYRLVVTCAQAVYMIPYTLSIICITLYNNNLRWLYTVVFDAIVTYSYMENAFTCMKAQAMTLSRVHVESLPKARTNPKRTPYFNRYIIMLYISVWNVILNLMYLILIQLE